MNRHFAALLIAASALSGVQTGEARAQSYGGGGVRLPSYQAALVRTLLNGVSARRRAEAALQLGESGDPRVLEALATAAAHDTEPDVRRAARQAIRQIRGGQIDAPPRPGPFPPPQPQDPNVVLVESWYQRYLGRSADRGGLGTFAGMLARGTPADQVQATLLASDEFWRRYGGTPAGFIGGLYECVLSRSPTRGEVGNWGQRFNLHRGDRTAVALEFLAAAQQELLRTPSYDPVYPY